MKGLIGKKIGMTQIYDETGKVTPVTVIQAGPCTVIGQMTEEINGYSAVQLGFGERKAKNVSKAVKGHCAKSGKAENPPAMIREIRTEKKDGNFEVGSVLNVDLFKENDFIDVAGTTKGRGFQGVVRRHKFGGGRASHGGGWTRKPGSIGNRTFPAKIDKNKRMPGQMGNVSRTVQNLQIMRINKDENLLFVKGAIPGPTNGIVIVRSAKKKVSA